MYTTTIKLTFVSFMFALAGLGAPAFAQTHQPNTGQGGYQEIALDESTFYVGFMGNAGDPSSGVEAGWRRRAVELCGAKGAGYFVELAYSFEDPRVNGKDMLAHNDEPGWMMPVKGVVYIPIFIPSAGGRRFIDGPVKQAPVRCYRDKPDLIDPARLQALKP